jgi:hypothetical protein
MPLQAELIAKKMLDIMTFPEVVKIDVTPSAFSSETDL